MTPTASSPGAKLAQRLRVEVVARPVIASDTHLVGPTFDLEAVQEIGCLICPRELLEAAMTTGLCDARVLVRDLNRPMVDPDSWAQPSEWASQPLRLVRHLGDVEAAAIRVHLPERSSVIGGNRVTMTIATQSLKGPQATDPLEAPSLQAPTLISHRPTQPTSGSPDS